MNKLKKYKQGGKVNNYMQDPNEVLAEDSIMKGKALYEGESNPYLNIMDMFGNAMMNYGISQGGLGDSATGQLGNAAMPMIANSFEYGGTVKSKTVEVEGDEMIETPNGEIAKLKGPSHKEGGIKMDLPYGTEVYSQTIKGADGKTMAERKELRTKRLSKVEQALKDTPTDKILKDTLKAVSQENEAEEAEDMQMQDFMTLMSQAKNGELEKFVYGGMVGVDGKPLPQAKPIWWDYTGQGQMTKEDFTDLPEGLVDHTAKTVDPVGNITESVTSDPNAVKNGITGGDAIGLAGALYSAFSPLNQAYKTRSGDKVNENYFKDYGKEGMELLDESGNAMKMVADENLKDLNRNRHSAIKRGRNSSRGVNTMRAMDLATEQGVNRQQNQIYNGLSQGLAGLLQQKAQARNAMDRVVMGGEKEADIANRQQRDNFLTQVGQGKQIAGEGMQHIGGQLNKITGKNDNITMIEQMKELGYEDNQINVLMQMFLKSLPKKETTKKGN